MWLFLTWHHQFCSSSILQLRPQSALALPELTELGRLHGEWGDNFDAFLLCLLCTISTVSTILRSDYLQLSTMFWLHICFQITGVLLLISVLEIGWLLSELKWLIPASNQKHVGLRLVEHGEDTLGDFYYYFEPKGDRIGSAFDPLWLSLQEVRK